MKLLLLSIVVGCALLVAVAKNTHGAPQSGIGLYGGVVGHAFYQPLLGGDARDFSSAGAALAGDAQFVWNDEWSVNPAFQVSLERITGGNIAGDLFAYSALLQVRRWRGDVYAAAHVAIYKEVIRAQVRTFGTGDGGFGVAAGWEAVGQPLINVQYDWERALTGERIQALRVQFGYRCH